MTELEHQSAIDRILDQWKRRKWLALIAFLSVFTIGACLVIALPQLYRSSTTILFTQDDIAESLLKTGVTNELELRLSIIRQAVLSRSQLQELIDEFDLYPKLRAGASPETVINRFRQDIRIEQQASTQPQWGQLSTYAITISYQDWDPDRAALIANELATRYRIENEQIRTGHAARTTEFVRDQLESARAKFQTQERLMNDFKNSHLSELPEQQDFNMATLDRLNSELRLNGERQVQLLDRRPEARLAAGGNPLGKDLAGLTGSQRLQWLQRELAELETRFMPNHPDVIRLKREIDSVQEEMALAGRNPAEQTDAQRSESARANADGELAALRRDERRLRSSIDGLVASLQGTPRIEQELKRFAHEYDSAKSEYLSLQQLYQDANLAESLESRRNQQFRVIEVAIPPDSPVAPDRQRLLFVTLLLAVAVAGAAMFLAEQLNTGFRTNAEIRQFTRVPLLASIPRILTAGEQWRSRARFSLVSVFFITGLLALALTSFYAGSHADQLVLAISS